MGYFDDRWDALGKTAEDVLNDTRELLAQCVRDRAAMRAALEAVEWVEVIVGGSNWATEMHCAWCDRFASLGHAPDCRRQVALGLAGP